MGRIGPVVAAVVVAAFGATTTWALAERGDLEGRVARLEDALDSANERIDASAAARRAVAEAAVASAQKAKRTTRRADALEARLYGTKVDLQRLDAVAAALSEPGRDVFETRLLRGGEDDLLAVSWHRGGATIFSGIDVWRVARGDDSAWELVYVTEPRPSFDLDTPSYVLYGLPESPAREEVDFIQMIDISDAGDADGDGRDDLAIQETGPGTGACGYVKLLRNTGTSLVEAYRHEGCGHGLSIKRGHLVLGEAWDPKGCNHIHGCGWRDTWMRWTGSSWEVTDVRRERF